MKEYIVKIKVSAVSKEDVKQIGAALQTIVVNTPYKKMIKLAAKIIDSPKTILTALKFI